MSPRGTKRSRIDEPLTRVLKGPVNAAPYVLLDTDGTTMVDAFFYWTTGGAVLVGLTDRGVPCRCWYTHDGVVSIEGRKSSLADICLRLQKRPVRTLYLTSGSGLGKLSLLAANVRVLADENRYELLRQLRQPDAPPVDEARLQRDFKVRQARGSGAAAARLRSHSKRETDLVRPVGQQPATAAAVPSYEDMLALDETMTRREYDQFAAAVRREQQQPAQHAQPPPPQQQQPWRKPALRPRRLRQPLP